MGITFSRPGGIGHARPARGATIRALGVGRTVMTMTAVTTRRHLGGATVALAAATMTATTMTATTMAAGSAHAARSRCSRSQPTGSFPTGSPTSGPTRPRSASMAASPGVVWFSAPRPVVGAAIPRSTTLSSASTTAMPPPGEPGRRWCGQRPGPWSGSRRVKLFTGRGPVSRHRQHREPRRPVASAGVASFTALTRPPTARPGRRSGAGAPP